MGFWGRMDSCTCMAESLHCPPEAITALLISCTPTQSKKLKRDKGEGRRSPAFGVQLPGLENDSLPSGQWGKSLKVFDKGGCLHPRPQQIIRAFLRKVWRSRDKPKQGFRQLVQILALLFWQDHGQPQQKGESREGSQKHWEGPHLPREGSRTGAASYFILVSKTVLGHRHTVCSHIVLHITGTEAIWLAMSKTSIIRSFIGNVCYPCSRISRI